MEEVEDLDARGAQQADCWSLLLRRRIGQQQARIFSARQQPTRLLRRFSFTGQD